MSYVLKCQWLKENYNESLEEIDSGTYGRVFSTKEVKTGRKKALKVIFRDQLDDKTEWINEAIKEILTLKTLSTENSKYIVMLENFNIEYDMDFEIRNPQKKLVTIRTDLIFLVMELADSSLDKLLKLYNGCLPKNLLDNLVLSLLEGLTVAHKKQIVHRDLKPANILFVKPNNFLISDWGIARFMKKIGTIKTKNQYGTLPYWAPEMFDIDENIDNDINMYKADLFSCGLIIFEACGIPLSTYRNNVRRNQNDHDSDLLAVWEKRWKNNPDTTYEKFLPLIQKLCQFNPKERPYIGEITEVLFKDLFNFAPNPEEQIKLLKEEITKLKKEKSGLEKELFEANDRIEVLELNSTELIDIQAIESLFNIKNLQNNMELSFDFSGKFHEKLFKFLETTLMTYNKNFQKLKINISGDKNCDKNGSVRGLCELFSPYREPIWQNLTHLELNMSECLNNEGLILYLAAGIGSQYLRVLKWDLNGYTDIKCDCIVSGLARSQLLEDLELKLGRTMYSDRNTIEDLYNIIRFINLKRLSLDMNNNRWIKDAVILDLIRSLEKLQLNYINLNLRGTAASMAIKAQIKTIFKNAEVIIEI